MAELEPSSLALRQLSEGIERLRTLLTAHAARGVESVPPRVEVAPEREPPATARTPLERLAAVFGLSRFELDVLVLCAACELDAPFAALCRRASVDSSRLRPGIGLALACLPGANWAALAPHAPLRRFQLLRVHNERAIADAELSIDEPVLHYLLSGAFHDMALDSAIQPLEPSPLAMPSQVELVRRIADVWRSPGEVPPIVQLVGPDPRAALDLLAGLAHAFEIEVLRIDAALLPSATTELEAKRLAWDRLQSVLGAIGVLDVASQSPDRTPVASAVDAWLEASTGPMLLLARTRRALGARTCVTFELEAPERREQVALWVAEIDASFRAPEAQALRPRRAEVDAAVEQLVGVFSLPACRIRSVCAGARGLLVAERGAAGPERSFASAVWQACRVQARPDLDAYARRLKGNSRFEDLCVGPRTRATLEKICNQIRHRGVVHGRWDVGGKSRRGLGVSALFAGPSGTGKTLAAEVIGNELDLDVYQVDLSATVSKYIGETEKNLERVFDAAEGSGVILLFDEADALFGKRTEVKDSHDRHANVEIGYLLQRLEAYQGLAILTTNLREDLDQAFLRRLRFIVEFAHPNALERLGLWRGALHGGVPVADVDLEALASLPLTGGQIRNVVMNAAFAAAAAERSLDGALLREAIVHELEKSGQRLAHGELGRIAGPAKAALGSSA